MHDFAQLEWDDATADDCRQLVRLAVREDLGRWHDWTTLALVPAEAQGRAAVVFRRAGVVCGLRAAALALAEMDPDAVWTPDLDDGAHIAAGQRVATLGGSVRTLLAAERPVLNFIGRLSGISTLAQQFAAAVTGTSARIYDTRKTTPGWRRLEKYAVRCGGARNHRTGLFDAVLIKDNHLACGATADAAARYTPAQAVARAREFLAAAIAGRPDAAGTMLVEVEVDTLEQLAEVLPAGPDIVLLDNMSPAQLKQAVAMRDRLNPAVELEASGGVSLATVAEIARSGVERISAGALTHSATWCDVGLDWLGPLG